MISNILNNPDRHMYNLSQAIWYTSTDACLLSLWVSVSCGDVKNIEHLIGTERAIYQGGDIL